MATDKTQIDPFTNIPYAVLPGIDPTQNAGGSFFSDLRELSAGVGSEVFRLDKQGLWLGAKTFDDAPFSVSMAGAVIASSLTITGSSTIDFSNVIGSTKPDDNADVTSAHPQSVSWLTDAGAMAYEDMVEKAKLGSTIISGGYIKTDLLTADNIVTGTLTGRTVQSNTSGNYRVMLENTGSPYLPNSVSWYDSSNSILGRVIASTSGSLLVSGDSVDIVSNGTIWSEGDLLPGRDGSDDLGTSSYRWNNLYSKGAIITTAVEFDYSTLNEIQKGSYVMFRMAGSDSTNIQVGMNMYPITDDNNYLGNSSHKWYALYTDFAIIDYLGQNLNANAHEINNLSYLKFNSSYGKIYYGATQILDFYSNALACSVPFGFQVRSGTPGSASSFEGYMYYDTAQTDMVFSNGSDWYKLNATKI